MVVNLIERKLSLEPETEKEAEVIEENEENNLEPEEDEENSPKLVEKRPKSKEELEKLKNVRLSDFRQKFNLPPLVDKCQVFTTSAGKKIWLPSKFYFPDTFDIEIFCVFLPHWSF